MWSPEGWVSITAEEVVKNNPYIGTVSYSREMFFCEICGQYVGLANGPQRKYFKHSSTTNDKECEERSRNWGRLDWTKKFEPPKLEPPLIICVGKYEFHFELNGVRLSTANILGDLDERGELFSSTSGKRLLPDSDVRLNKKYYLLTKEQFAGAPLDVRLADTNIKYLRWRLYEVEATALTQTAANFFLASVFPIDGTPHRATRYSSALHARSEFYSSRHSNVVHLCWRQCKIRHVPAFIQSRVVG